MFEPGSIEGPPRFAPGRSFLSLPGRTALGYLGRFVMLSDEVRRFIKENAEESPEALALMAGRFPHLPMAMIAQQVKGRQRIRQKLPSWHAHPDTVFPKSLALEQCSSERVARYRASLAPAGARALDMTGGFGVDARFLAERFGRYLYCERDAELAEIARENFSVFGLQSCIDIIITDGREALESLEGTLDLIFLDPARRDGRSLKVSALSECEPDIVAIWPKLRKKARTVMVKASPGLDLSSAIADLAGVSQAQVISVDGECKELLLIASSGCSGIPEIHCVNLLKSGEVETLSFSLEEEKALAVEYGPPGRFLYEPNASIMKAGAFKSVARRWGIRPLNPRTRLYGSGERVEGFPGRVFEIVGRGALAAKDAKRLFPGKRANVISRNSGLSAVELRQKLKLKDGGELFAVGAAVSGEGRRLFACRLVAG